MAKHIGLFLLLAILLLGCVNSIWSMIDNRPSQAGYSRLAAYIPWSDASHYVSNAVRLSEVGPPLDDWGCRRPWHHVHLSSLMRFAGDDLMKLAWTDTILNWLAILLAMGLVSRVWGGFSGLLFGAILAAYSYSNFHLTFLSENSGFFWSVLSAALWLWWWQSRAWTALIFGGIFLMVALSARAGAYFIVPAILVSLLGSRTEKGRGFRDAMLYAAGIVAAFFLMQTVQDKVCKSDQIQNANMAFSLYGLASGGKSWTSFFEDFPLAKTFSEKLQYQQAMSQSLNKIKNQPELLATGFVRNLGYYLDRHFAVTSQPWAWLEKAVILLVIAVLLAFRTQEAREFRPMLAAILFGLLVSAPFLVRDGHSRVFASVIGFYALLPAFLFAKKQGLNWSQELAAAVIALFGMAILMFTLLHVMEPPLNKPLPDNRLGAECPEGYTWSAMRRLGHSQVNIRNDLEHRDWLQTLRRQGNEDSLAFAGTRAPGSIVFGLMGNDFKPAFLWNSGNWASESPGVCVGPLLPGAYVVRQGVLPVPRAP